MSRYSRSAIPGLVLAALVQAPGALAADGKAVYEKYCTVCHTAGVAGAPKLDATDDWKERIAQGMDTLNEHAIKGFTGKKGMMPPKGGAMQLSDEEVKAAVKYMVDEAS